MSDPSNTSATVELKPRPPSIRAVLLTIVAILFAAAMAGLAYCMIVPLHWDGAGKFGAMALYFPLHLLVFSMLAAVFAYFAKLSRARTAGRIFLFTALLTAVMALAPAICLWNFARRQGVSLSIGNYLVNARDFNKGDVQLDRSVTYGTAYDGTKLQLDVWSTGLGKSGPLRPALFFFHGGAWVSGHRSIEPKWDQWFNSLSYEVFDVEYRMPPPVRWLDEIGDVKSAIGYVASHSSDYHVDPRRISLMGSSAGGTLAMLAGYTAGDPRLPASCDVSPVPIRCVINFYGPCDMTVGYHDFRSDWHVRGAIERYIGGPPEQFPDRYRLLSPVTHIGALSPPTITFIGTLDRLVGVKQAEMLDESLGAARVPHDTIVFPATDHGFDANWGGFATQIARAKIRQFLEEHDPG